MLLLKSTLACLNQELDRIMSEQNLAQQKN